MTLLFAALVVGTGVVGPQGAPTTASAPAPGAGTAPTEVIPAPPDVVADAAAGPQDEIPPPPDVAAGERSDGRLDPMPKRRWRLLPQVLLFPLRGLFWLICWPTGAALRLEDRAHPIGRFMSWFTWNDGARGLRPAFYYSTIYVPEFGLRYFDNLSLGVDRSPSRNKTSLR